jgi:hypothetical protein
MATHITYYHKVIKKDDIPIEVYKTNKKLNKNLLLVHSGLYHNARITLQDEVEWDLVPFNESLKKLIKKYVFIIPSYKYSPRLNTLLSRGKWELNSVESDLSEFTYICMYRLLSSGKKSHKLLISKLADSSFSVIIYQLNQKKKNFTEISIDIEYL